MSSTASTNPPRRRRKQTKPKRSAPTSDDDAMPRGPHAQTTSLESISIQPRTPKTPRANGVNGWTPADADAIDEVELSLLGEDERREAAHGLSLEEEQAYLSQADKKPMSTKDKRAIALLIILCELCERL